MSSEVDLVAVAEAVRRVVCDQAVRLSADPWNLGRPSTELVAMAVSRVRHELRLCAEVVLPLVEDGRVREG